MRFSDGMTFDTSGPLRTVRKSDGLYVVGNGMLIPVNDYDEAEALIEQLSPKQDESELWELHDNLGGGDHANEILFDNLVRFLSGDTLDDFVDDFRRCNGMVVKELEEPDSATDIIPLRQGLEDEDDESAEYCAPV